MKSIVAISFLMAGATVGCTPPTPSVADSYDSSATWAALNQSQAESDFYSGMRQRLENLEFVCASESEGLTGCVKKSESAMCAYTETIEFNSSGVSRYLLDKNCAA